MSPTPSPVSWSVVILLGLLLSGCASRAPDEDPQRVAKADQAVAALERTFTALRDLPPRERRERYLALQPQLEEAVVLTTDLPAGYREVTDAGDGGSLAASGPMRVAYNYHAKTLYWLASWRLLYARGEGVDELLDRLERQLSQVLLHSGRALRVQVRLRQGRTAEARTMAEALAQRMPETAGLLDLVAWFEQTGQSAPRLPARVLDGGEADPWAADGRWILTVFTADASPDTRFYLERLRTALAALPEARRPRLVQVSFDGTPLQAARLGAPGEVLLWANPNAPGEGPRWRTAWKLPDPLPRNALLGADRTILAVEVQPEQIAELVK